MQLTIEVDEKDVRTAIASVPESWWQRSDSSPVLKIAFAVKAAYEAQKKCRWCDEGNTRIQSSVSDKFVHHTDVGRVMCEAPWTDTLMITHRQGPEGELLIATPPPLQAAIAALCGLQAGVVVLAVPPMICAGCGKPRSLFVNAGGKTVCVSDCAAPGAIDG